MPRLSKKREQLTMPVTASALTLSYQLAERIEERKLQLEQCSKNHKARSDRQSILSFQRDQAASQQLTSPNSKSGAPQPHQQVEGEFKMTSQSLLSVTNTPKQANLMSMLHRGRDDSKQAVTTKKRPFQGVNSSQAGASGSEEDRDEVKELLVKTPMRATTMAS